MPTGWDVTEGSSIATSPAATLVTDPAEVSPEARTITVGPADSGRMIPLRLGDRLAIDAPDLATTTWRLRGGAPMLAPTTPRSDEPRFVLTAVKAGRTGVDLVASGTPATPVRPLRFIVAITG